MTQAVICGGTRPRQRKSCGANCATEDSKATKFRRQHPIDRYVVDFYCAKARLAIELDGGGHSYLGREREDDERTKFLASKGIVVLRFWNHQVREDIDAVMQTIFWKLEERSGGDPSP